MGVCGHPGTSTQHARDPLGPEGSLRPAASAGPNLSPGSQSVDESRGVLCVNVPKGSAPKLRWGAKWSWEPRRRPWARSIPESPGPSRRRQRRSGLPELSQAQGGEENRASGVCAVARLSPWRPSQPRSVAPGRVRSLFLPAEYGERRGKGEPPLPGALHSSTSCICASSGQTGGGAQAPLASPIAGVGAACCPSSAVVRFLRRKVPPARKNSPR